MNEKEKLLEKEILKEEYILGKEYYSEILSKAREEKAKKYK